VPGSAGVGRRRREAKPPAALRSTPSKGRSPQTPPQLPPPRACRGAGDGGPRHQRISTLKKKKRESGKEFLNK
jgi:hypothetical protein